MARVNVEQKALTDPRFYRLGLELGAEPGYAQAAGLFAMIRVWNECIERGKYVLDGWVIQAIMARSDGASLVERSDLAVALSDNRFRIRGTKGRVEYLEEKRKLARINGRKGGRPRKPTSVSTGTDVGVPGETPPAPAPAPAPALSEPPLGVQSKKRERAKRPPFVPPTVEQVAAYVETRPVKIDPQRFVDYYAAKGWLVGKSPMKDWQACVRTWEGNNFGSNGHATAPAARRTGTASFDPARHPLTPLGPGPGGPGPEGEGPGG